MLTLPSFPREVIIVAVITLVVAAPGAAVAGDAVDPDYVLFAGDEVCGDGGSASVAVGLDTTDGEGLTGYQWGLCHDGDIVSITTEDIANGADTTDLDDSELLFFGSFLVQDDAWTAGFLIEAGETLAPGRYPELAVATYSCDAEGTSELEFCTAGDPPTTTEVVVGSDTRITPTQLDGGIRVLGDFFFFGLADPAPEDADEDASEDGVDRTAEVRFEPDDGTLLAEEVKIEVVIQEADSNDGFPTDTQGFEVGLRHDPDFLTGLDVDPIGVLADLDDGAGPEFFGASFLEDETDDGPGLNVGVVYDLMSGIFLPFEDAEPVLELCYQPNIPADDADFFLGREEPFVTALEFVDTIGSPTIPNAVVAGTSSFEVLATDGAVAFEPRTLVPFIRGDCNLDDRVNIADAVRLLDRIFADFVPDLDCDAACEANADTLLDQSDVIFILNWRFLDGLQPPSPFPDCGLATDQEPEDCEENPICEDD